MSFFYVEFKEEDPHQKQMRGVFFCTKYRHVMYQMKIFWIWFNFDIVYKVGKWWGIEDSYLN